MTSNTNGKTSGSGSMGAGALLLGYRKSKDADAKQESPEQPANAALEAPETQTDPAD